MSGVIGDKCQINAYLAMMSDFLWFTARLLFLIWGLCRFFSLGLESPTGKYFLKCLTLTYCLSKGKQCLDIDQMDMCVFCSVVSIILSQILQEEFHFSEVPHYEGWGCKQFCQSKFIFL